MAELKVDIRDCALRVSAALVAPLQVRCTRVLDAAGKRLETVACEPLASDDDFWPAACTLPAATRRARLWEYRRSIACDTNTAIFGAVLRDLVDRGATLTDRGSRVTNVFALNAIDFDVSDIEPLVFVDAALAGEATYRELPEAWITRQVDARDGYAVVASETFPMTLSAASLRKQVTYARTTSAKITDAGLRKAYERRVAELTIEVNAWKGTHRKGRNYALVVKRS